MNDAPYIKYQVHNLKRIVEQIRNNASLHTRSELESLQECGREIDQAVQVNLDNDNYYDA